MNANELANELDNIWEDNECRNPVISKSADMLRQQEKEIEQLKADLKIVMDELVKETDENSFWHNKCNAQAKDIEDFRFVLRNLTLATSKKIGELEEELENCTCHGGHSEAYLKIKER
jgi:hypothetical protein